MRRLYSWGYQLLVRTLFRLNVRDTQVGAKVFRREMLTTVTPLLLVKQLRVRPRGARGRRRVRLRPRRRGAGPARLPVLRDQHQLARGPQHAARHARHRLPAPRPPLVREAVRRCSSASERRSARAPARSWRSRMTARGMLVGFGRIGLLPPARPARPPGGRAGRDRRPVPGAPRRGAAGRPHVRHPRRRAGQVEADFACLAAPAARAARAGPRGARGRAGCAWSRSRWRSTRQRARRGRGRRRAPRAAARRRPRRALQPGRHGAADAARGGHRRPDLPGPCPAAQPVPGTRVADRRRARPGHARPRRDPVHHRQRGRPRLRRDRRDIASDGREDLRLRLAAALARAPPGWSTSTGSRRPRCASCR